MENPKNGKYERTL